MQKLSLRFALALSLGAVLSGLDVPVQAAETQTQRAGRAAIVAAYQKQGQAFMRQDVDALLSFHTPDFQDYDSQGNVRNFAESEALLRRSFTFIDKFTGALGVKTRFTKYSTKILSLTWRGKDAIVMSQTTAVSMATKESRSSRTEIVSLSRDYWTPTAQGWKMRQCVERLSKTWINGQRMN